ncbi:MAG: gliding motility-associated ABC transporter substrate-binding protein GldG [Bacteroidales bacterium]
MFSLLKKEVRLFFSTPVAYLVLFLFFTVNSLMLFVLPTRFNLFDYGYASLDAFFSWAPLAFLFFIPAICMRSFAEERKTGTMEVLLTRPLTDFQIVSAKYLACLLLLVVALLPTFFYVYTVSDLASPKGNIDMAAFWGAYLGLLLLGAAFVSLCLFMSNITDNQIIAFALSVVFCAFSYLGFESISHLGIGGDLGLFLSAWGIESHYTSLSRGVIDLRDILYYVSFIALFILLNVMVLQKRNTIKWKGILIILLIIGSVNLLASFFSLRLDLTSDKRYTLMPVTKEILKEGKQPIYIKIYLTGDLPAGFKRLEKSVRETLDEFRIYQPQIRYQFIDIYAIEDEKTRLALMQELMEKGMQPTQLEVKTKEGLSRRLIFPSAEVRADGKFIPISLLSEQLGRSAEETLNASVENVELHFITAIQSLLENRRKSVAFLNGNGEWGYEQIASFGNDLSLFYHTVGTPLIQNPESVLRRDSIKKEWEPKYDLLIIAHPTQRFEEAQKYILDQYVMRGGRILWLIDPSSASIDSLRAKESSLALLYSLNLENLFFRYGFRIQNNIVLDKNACLSPVITSLMGNQPIIEFMPNVYMPLITPTEEKASQKAEEVHPILKEIGPLQTEFVAGIDTIENDLKKTCLLQTSLYSKKIPLPAPISADIMREKGNVQDFHQGEQAISWLLEGNFESAFRVLPLDSLSVLPLVRKSKNNRMIVISDGDMIKNGFISAQNQALPLGYDPYTRQMYDNKNFLLHCVHYLCEQPQKMALKSRLVQMRLMDKARLENEKEKWMIWNFAGPLCCVLIAGFLFLYFRKKQYIRSK